MQSLLLFSKSYVSNFISLLNRNSIPQLKLTFFALFTFVTFWAHGQVSVTTATGGINISADKAANAASPSFTALGDISIREANKQEGNFATNVTQIVLHAPNGWTFQTSGVTASVTATGGGAPDITVGTITFTSTAITIPLTVANTNTRDRLTFSGVAVRSTDGSVIPSSGNITPTFTGTITGLSTSTNLGSLSQAVGNASKLAFTTQPGPGTVGSTLSTQPIVKTQDQFGNLSTIGLGATVNVTVSLSAGTGPLVGTVMQNIGTGGGNGTITYTNLGINSAGTNKQLTAAATGLTSATSNAFTVNGTNTTTSLASNTNPSCAGSNITLTATITAAGLTATGTVEFFDGANSLGSSNVSGNQATLASSLSSGSHSLTATYSGDANLNTSTSSALTQTVTGLNVFNVTGGGSYCAGGAGVEVGLSGSETGVNYQLQLDGNPVGSIVNGTGSSITFGLQTAGGTYNAVAAHAAAGCTATMNGSVKVTVNAAAFNVTGGGTTTCVAGIEVGLSGSQTSVKYQLKKDGVNIGKPLTGTGSAISFGQRHQSGTYTVEATDTTTGCTNTMTGSAIVTTPDVTLTVANKSTCAGDPLAQGSITIDVASGGPYEFSINNGSFQGSGTHFTFTNPLLGDNTVQIRAINDLSCVATLSAAIKILLPVSVSLFQKSGTSCTPDNGEIVIDARNGPLPYTFNLIQGDNIISTQTSNKFMGLSAAVYTVSVTDARGCTDDTAGIEIAQGTPLTAKLFRKTAVSCLGNDGSIIISATGGKTPYKYSLNGGTFVTSNTFIGLAVGTYSVTVADAKGCTDDTAGIVLVQPLLSAKFSKTNVTCKGGTDGSITARPEGGVPPYQYSLSGPVNRDFLSSNIFSNLPAGTYTLTVKDSKGCTSTSNPIIQDGTVACTAAVSMSSSAASIKLNSYKGALKVQAMPNPSITEFALNLQSTSQERVQIIVTDMFGKKLYQKIGSSSQQYNFGKEFRSGTYIVQVIQGKEIQTLKLVKSN